MPPKKTTTRKKPAAKKAAPKKPAARKPAKRNYKKRKQEKKLPITALLAVIPMLLLGAFIVLRFTGGTAPVPTAPAAAPTQPEVQQQTVIQKVEAKSVLNTVKLFMFDNSISHNKLDINGSSINIAAKSEKIADSLIAKLKEYLLDNKITVDGGQVLTAEDSKGIYNISMTYPKPKPKPTPKPIPAPAKKAFKAKMAVVIDDCGYSMSLARELAGLHYPVTFAVIPFTPYGKETSKLARKSGKTVFLHFPMQPKSYPKFDPGKGALFLNMPHSVIAAVTKANFDWFPIRLDGANNHTGSAFTESGEKMSQALEEIKKYVPAFMDSYTSGRSVAYDVCRSSGLKCAVNNVFLDNEEPGLVTISDKKEHVHEQLVRAAQKALRDGHSIAIGHLRKATVAALADSFRKIEDMGVQIVPVTSLMN